MGFCYHCKKAFSQDFKVSRQTVCPDCARDVKVCKNCGFYALGSQWDCKETINEGVLDKEKANFCDYFLLKNTEAPAGEAADKAKTEEARIKFNALFNDD